MSALSNIATIILSTIGGLAVLIIVMRFLLQLVRADFYNPLSQFIVRFTNPVLIPLRRVIPGFAGLDIASLVLALIAQYVLITLLLLVTYGTLNLPWATMLIWSVFGITLMFVNIYFFGMLIVAIASWIAPNSYSPPVVLLTQILEPVIRPIRKIIPPMGGIDLSFIVLSLGIYIVKSQILIPMIISAGMPPSLLVLI
jgi:YggT family protein